MNLRLRLSALGTALWLVACGHSAQTEQMRMALDAGNPAAAVESLNRQMKLKSEQDLPKSNDSTNALFLLDRASIQQARAKFELSARDFQSADKAIDVLDLKRGAADDIGKYLYSDSAGRYRAPPYEKLLINTLNMINYLERRDLSGARVEARRLAVTQRYYRDSKQEGDSPILALGGFLAGVVFEKSGNYDEALRYYDDALGSRDLRSMDASIARLFRKSSYRSPRLEKHAARAPQGDDSTDDQSAELIAVVGYGRVPHKIAKRLPIGLALTYFADAIHPTDVGKANKLAAQGLVTWINFPALAERPDPSETPLIRVDGAAVPVEDAVSVSAEVRREWKRLEGAAVASSITRMIVRYAAGQAAGAAAGAAAGDKGGLVGFLASLVVQGALSAADTPDTRSWEALPARVAIVRTKIPAGRRTIELSARGTSRKAVIDVAPGAWFFVSLQALR